MPNVSIKSPDLAGKVKKFLPTSAQKIYAKDLQEDAATSAANYQRHQQREAEKPDLQSLYAALQSAINAPKRDRAIEKDLESQIKEITDRWAAEDAEREARQKDFMNNATPSAIGILEPWIRLDLKTHQKAFNFTEELPAGKTPRDMVDLYREANTPLQAKRTAILKAPQTMDETAAEVRAVVERTATRKLNPRSARHLDFNPDRNRFEQRALKFPNQTLFDGVGASLAVPDALGILCLLFPQEVTDRLTALACGGNPDDSRAMNRGDREAALAEVDAEILANDRRGEFWIRACRAKNIVGGPRWTQDPRAILDLA